MLADHISSQVEPPPAAVQNDVIRAGPDVVGCRKNSVGAGQQLDLQGPAGFMRHALDNRFEAAAVINRAVQPPTAQAHFAAGGELTDGSKRRDRLRHFVVARANSSQVPAESIAARQNHSTTQGGLDGGQSIKASSLSSSLRSSPAATR